MGGWAEKGEEGGGRDMKREVGGAERRARAERRGAGIARTTRDALLDKGALKRDTLGW